MSVVLVVAALVVVRWLLRAEVLGNFGVIDDSAAKASCPVCGEVSHLRTLIFSSLVASCGSSLVACSLLRLWCKEHGCWYLCFVVSLLVGGGINSNARWIMSLSSLLRGFLPFKDVG